MLSTTPGRSYPIGATVCAEGVHFCVYSKHATAVELVLFAVLELIGRLGPSLH